MSSSAPADDHPPDGAQHNTARDRSTQYIVQHGNLYVGAAPSYRVDGFGAPRRNVPPSRLLAARHQVVDFIGRETELAGLTAWRDDADLGLTVRLVHGPGGQGKTRLAAHFAQRCAELGWTVAQAVHRSHAAALGAALGAAPVDSSGLLLIVDYAERWPLSDLLDLARDSLLRTGAPTRVLLLSRPAGGWWDSLSYRLTERFGIATDGAPLATLAGTVAARTAVFTAARDSFAALLDVPDPGRIPAPDHLSADAFGLVLTLHMAALAAVDAHARGERPPPDPAALSAYLLHRERDHWQAMHENGQRVRTPPQVMARAVFTATLTRPQPYPDGVAALRRVGLPDPEQVLDDHRLCYPPGDPATVCEPLYPDRLGEDFLALSTPGHGLATHEPDAWAGTAAARLLADVEGSDGEQHRLACTPQAVTVLIETARRWPHIAQCQLFPLLRKQPGLALAAGGTALTRLAEVPDVDLGVLEAIEPLLPDGRHVDLDLAVAAITSRLTQHRLATTTGPAARARLHGNLGYRLAHAGRRDEALAATTEAVHIRRLLADKNPATFQPDLATSLNNLGSDLSNLGRRDEALDATTEATDIYRRLADQNPATFQPDLAASLNNLGIRLSNLGRRDEALAATTEAVHIRRRLADQNPATFEPDLARGLWGFAWVRAAGQAELSEALDAALESVDIYERLAERLPEAFIRDLRSALGTLARVLDHLGRDNEAGEVRERIEQLGE